MIEIIPNWHPLLVHFTVGLLSTSVLFYLASATLSLRNSWKQQWLNMANWSLWSGCLFAIGTAYAGWLAYNSVAHDSTSHAAMTLHRNWALPTASIFLLLGLWAIVIAKKDRRPGFLFLTFSTIAAGLLMVTGWLGAEAVYRYGLGVKSLPVVTEGADGHNHSHGADHNESAMGEGEHQHGTTETEKPLQPDGHQHEHLLPSVIEGTDGHNHSHGAEHNESIMGASGHQHKNITITDKNTKPTVQLPDINLPPHNSNAIAPIVKPLDQGNASEKISILPSELHSLQHTDVQNKEPHKHTH